ncbi:hypothetical protein HY285_00450 [Candidatus Peregrinibacteria bacterium]|nr:hypothetical protein [Candidatus Peregrinibacteria bacterium]MBI3816002.1 hypothetical protein [Candidatus Peregrinibacteria bacterium]
MDLPDSIDDGYTWRTFISFMQQDDIQKRLDDFLAELGIPGFVIFGWKKSEDEFGVASSYRDVPAPAAIKGVSWALNDLINKTM